jgi:hypothetical protein
VAAPNKKTKIPNLRLFERRRGGAIKSVNKNAGVGESAKELK